MSFVATHTLNDPDPKSEISLLKSMLYPAAETLKANPRSTGLLFVQSLRLLGLLASQNASKNELFNALAWVKELGVALFTRGQNRPSVPARIHLNNETFEVPSGASEFNTALNWNHAFGAAMVLRDTEAMTQLCQYNPRDFEGEYDHYHIALAVGLMALHQGDEDGDAIFDEALKQAHNSTLFPAWGQLHGVPTLQFITTVLKGNVASLDTQLRHALESHKSLFEQPENSHFAQWFLPLLVLGFTALAHDIGLPITTESDYLIPWLIDAEFPST